MKRKLAFIIVLAICASLLPGFMPGTGNSAEAASSTTCVFRQATVTAPALNMRQGPSTSFRVITILDKGQKVLVTCQIGNWYSCYDTKTGYVGCVSGTHISLAPLATPAPAPSPAPSPAAVTLSQDEQTLMNLINKARADAGIGPLSADPGVMRTARLKAQDMVNNNYFAHQSPTYGSPFDMMRDYGVMFRTAGENIAGNSTVQGAFNAWMNSSGHRANILNGSFNYTGIGIVVSQTYGKVLCQQFIGR